MDGASEGVARMLHQVDQMGIGERLALALKGSDLFKTQMGQKGIAEFVARQQDPTMKANMPLLWARAQERLAALRGGQQGLPQQGMFAPGSTAEQYGTGLRDLLARHAPAA